jgi:esterase/lipase superfamily enzyme
VKSEGQPSRKLSLKIHGVNPCLYSNGELKINYIKHQVQIFGIVFLVSLIAAYGPDDYAIAQSDANKTTYSEALSEDGSQRTVAFITLRNKTGNSKATKFFGDDRSIRRAGHCILSRTPLKALQPIAENAPFYIPDDVVVLDEIRERSLVDLWRDLEATRETRRPILYTHGYFINFERGCKRASIFQASQGLAGRFLLFSWPSDGAILNYTRDVSDLHWSVAPLVQTLSDMVGHFGAGGFDVTAHSLGTRGVFLALVQMAGSEPVTKPLINHLVFLAADIDIGIFKQYLPRIQPLARNITIYVSANDKPLALSSQLNGYPRLGESGSHLDGLTGVDIIDLSEIPVRYPSGHVYHLYNNIVASDLAQLLSSGKQASQRSLLKQTGENYWLLQPAAVSMEGAGG